MLPHQGQFVFDREGAARSEEAGLREPVIRADGIDGAYEVAMVRDGGEGGELQAAYGEEDAPRLGADRRSGGRHCRDLRPAIARLRGPRRPAGVEKRDAGEPRRLARIRRHGGGEGMRGVDQHVDVLRPRR